MLIMIIQFVYDLFQAKRWAITVNIRDYHRRFPANGRALPIFLMFSVSGVSAFGQGDPWTSSANNLRAAFTGPIATALIAVAVVITGLVFAFSEGQGKRQISGLIFGGAMALGAVRFMSWIFS
jgi:type IV secretory pathway VirB2 component (pilin)